MEYALESMQLWLRGQFEQMNKRFEGLVVKVDKLSEDHSNLAVAVAELEGKFFIPISVITVERSISQLQSENYRRKRSMSTLLFDIC